MRYKKNEKQTEQRQPAPKVTLAEMMLIAKKVEEETGHYPSYGEIYADIHFGRIKPEKYIKRGKK